MILNKASPEPKLTLFWRGGSWKPTLSQIPKFYRSLSARPTAWQWSDSLTMIEAKAARPYIKYEHEVVQDGHDRIHMAFTDGHPRDEPSNGIYYACMENGVLRKGNLLILQNIKN